ncbi:MAG: sugar ABC transporter substrate-binding protein [Firmicutes bacterium]|nr:sugar ABC transporter substrate-binding protein [Bacillota bacterium]
MKRLLGVFMLVFLLMMTFSALAVENITLRFVVWDYDLSPEYKEAISAFESKNPNINVEVVDVASKDYGDKLTIMLSAGEDLDVLAVKDMPGYSAFIGRNQLEPLNTYMERDGFEPAVYSGLMDEIEVDGKYYGMPFRSDAWILYYNKEIFDQAGVDYPTNDMTWEEFRTKAKEITSGSANKKTYGAYIHTWKSLAMNLGVQKAEGQYTLADGEYDFLAPAYELYLKMQYEDKSVMTYGETVTSSAHYRTQFEAGKTGMVYMGTWNIGALISDAKKGKHDVKWGIVKSPHWSGQEPGITIANVTPLAINAASKNKEAAWKFIKFVGGEEGAIIFAKHGVLPALKSDEVLNVYTNADGFPDNAKAALGTSVTFLEFPPDPNAQAIDKILQEEHELIMIQENSIAEGIEAMERRVADVINW